MREKQYELYIFIPIEENLRMVFFHFLRFLRNLHLDSDKRDRLLNVFVFNDHDRNIALLLTLCSIQDP